MAIPRLKILRFAFKTSQERPWLFRNGPGNKQQKTRDPQTFIG